MSLRRAAALVGWGVGGGLAAALLLVGLSLAFPGVGRTAEYAAIAAGLLAVHLGLRGDAQATARALLLRTLALAGLTTLALGAGAYALYAWWRPELLAARFAGYLASVGAMPAPPERIAAELARLQALREAYLDPFYQAVSLAGTLGFFAVLLGGFVAFGAHKARRFRGPGGRR